LEAHENYINYKFNPKIKKVNGIKQHSYIENIREDQEIDNIIFGKDLFIKSNINQDTLIKTHNQLRGNNNTALDHS
jgi:hypothetical protein